MVNIAVLASGSGTNFEKLVEYFSANNDYAKIACLISDKGDSLVLKKAERLNIEHYFINPRDYDNKAAYEQQVLKVLQKHGVHLIVLAGYMRFIGAVLLSNYDHRIINLHPALLPAFVGAHSIQEAYDAKVKYSGVTIHYVDEGIDTGEIIAQESVKLLATDSIEKFEQRIHLKEYELFAPVIEKICIKIEEEKINEKSTN